MGVLISFGGSAFDEQRAEPNVPKLEDNDFPDQTAGFDVRGSCASLLSGAKPQSHRLTQSLPGSGGQNSDVAKIKDNFWL